MKLVAGILVHDEQLTPNIMLDDNQYSQIELDKTAKQILFSCAVRELKHTSDNNTQLRIINDEFEVYFTTVECLLPYVNSFRANPELVRDTVRLQLMNAVLSTLTFPNTSVLHVIVALYDEKKERLGTIM